MQNFSFFEVIESQARQVLKALNKVSVSGRKVVVEVAEENEGNSDKAGKKRERPAVSPEAPAKKAKPSREERGYTAARGPKRKDDWKQFFVHADYPLKGEVPDFGEEGWAKPKKGKKKK